MPLAFGPPHLARVILEPYAGTSVGAYGYLDPGFLTDFLASQPAYIVANVFLRGRMRVIRRTPEIEVKD